MIENRYNGNRALKQIGYEHEYTHDQVKEILECKDDPIYFIKTYCKIISLDSEQLIPFDLFPYQERFISALHNNRRVISMQPRQLGKALDIDTDIPTPSGFVKMKDLQVGDQVFDMFGQPTTITFKSYIHLKPTYRIIFSDDTSIISCEDHKWYGYDYHGSNRYRKELREFTTKQITETGVLLYNSEKEYRYAIPLCNPVQYDEKVLPIDPYMLGLWLGDGSSDEGALTMLEDDFNNIKHLITLPYEIRRYSKKNQQLLYIKIHGLRRLLKENNLLKNKHIPQDYLISSELQRRQLLAGLMDTDGHANGTTHVSITQALFRDSLLQQIKEIISSLGYKVHVYTYNSEHPSKTLSFCTHDYRVFNLERKAKRQKLAVTSKSRKKQIVKIELIETKPTQCIAVDAQTHTYLCTRDYTVTHNTQTVAAYILWYTLFNNNKTAAILAYKSDAAMEVLSRYQLMYESIPLWMQQGIKTWNKGDVDLENGSSVFTAATSSSGIRGKSCNFLYVDEAAIIPNNIAENFFTSVYPVVSAGETTKIALTSTPLGYNHFWKFWNDAENGVNGFIPVLVKYTDHPNRDQKWADDQRAILGEVKFSQEILCSFIGSTNTLINAETIARLSAKPYIHSKDNLDVIEEPNQSRSYFITVDTSRGVGGDYSAFTVVDTTEYPFKVVAKYRNNKISPLLYPTVIHKVAKDYNNAFILVEINDIGQQIADIIYRELEYENMIWVGSDSRYGQHLSSDGRGANLGVRTTKQIKRIGCATLKALIENNKLLIFDSDIISEISTFIERHGSYEADEGYYDDLIMTLVLFAWASNDGLFKDMMNNNNREALFKQQIANIEESLTPFGFINTGISEEMLPEVASGDLWLTDGYQKDLKEFIDNHIH